MMHDYWYLSRAAAFTAYGLLTISTLLGIWISSRNTGWFSRNTLFDLHRFTAILALVISAFHAVILLGDTYFNFSPLQLALPFASPYRPWQTAAGAFGIYLMAIIVMSFSIRKALGYRTWRVIHFSTFALFAIVTVHGLTAGSDTTEPWARLLYLACGLSVLLLTFYRVQQHAPVVPQWRRSAVGMAGIAAAIGMALILTTAAIRPSVGGDEDTSAASLAILLDHRAVANSPAVSSFLTAQDDDEEEHEHRQRDGDHDEGDSDRRGEHEEDD